jgi:gamma-glutamyl hercynylcysteine S-oxide synthase
LNTAWLLLRNRVDRKDRFPETLFHFHEGRHPRAGRGLIGHWRFVVCLALLGLISGRLRAQETANPPVDAQIPGPKSAADFKAWLADVRHWRYERLIRMGYDGSEYARPELKWTQRNLVCAQMMVEERNFYDPNQGKYTVDRYLDELQKAFGGVDSVLVWDTYPDLGVDDRNQYDRLRDMPGGIAGVEQMVADFHRRAVKVLFPETPWDEGTREEAASHWTAQARLMAQVGADGLLGDTMDGIPRAFRVASDRLDIRWPYNRRVYPLTKRSHGTT